jgi:membrane protease YdiL (CAAX protease family)
MDIKKIIIYLSAILVSILPDILVLSYFKSVYSWVLPIKMVLLAALFIFSMSRKDKKPILDFLLVCLAMTVIQFFSDQLKTFAFWKHTFPSATFVTNLSGSMVLKSISVIAVLLVLYVRLKDRKAFFLVKGDLHAKASTIKWLGIEGDRIAWGKLALISGILIATVTFIATIMTVTGFKMPSNMTAYLRMLPVILIFAFLNSLFEGIVYRNGILGTLSRLLPKEEAILVAAMIFGMGHYYGAPGGIVGALMSTLLGWYMGRSVLETNGMASAWLIHFMQDTVIFSAFFLFAF